MSRPGCPEWWPSWASPPGPGEEAGSLSSPAGIITANATTSHPVIPGSVVGSGAAVQLHC